MILFKLLVAAAIGSLLLGHLRREGVGLIPASVWLFVASMLLVPGLLPVRPQLFTYLFVLLTVLIIHRADRGSHGWLWAAPPIFILWVNLHGGFLAGVGILLVWAIGHLVERRWWRRGSGRARRGSDHVRSRRDGHQPVRRGDLALPQPDPWTPPRDRGMESPGVS